MRIAGLALTVLLAAASAHAEELTGRVSYVVDGDSLILASRTKVRLWGIDSPELAQTCDTSDGKPYPCGLSARRTLQNFIGNKPIRCQPLGQSYGRVVARCFAGDRDLSARMVASGYAIDYARHSHRYYAREERKARRNRLGLWSGRFQRPAKWRHDHPRQPEAKRPGPSTP